MKDDIAMQPAADPALVESISDLAKRLRKRGTVLVYVPIPSRSQSMPKAVPPSAWLYGYQEVVNATIYEDAVSRLGDANVVTVDLLEAFQNADAEMVLFQKADPLWTAEGARLAAQAVAKEIKSMPAYRKANLMRFSTIRKDDMTRPSDLRTALQAHCANPLPPVVDATFETTGEEAFAADRPFNVLGADAPPPAVLVGSKYSADGQSHFDGFLKQYAGLQVENRADVDDYPFQSMMTYLASQDFQENPPLFLVWEVPAGSNLARFGPRPWETLSAYAAGECADDAAGCSPIGAEQ
nr:hypothetical protein [Marinicella sp. W31]MDC2878130.1 hypothetical protein [Marinicella sp. W31]